MSAPAVLTSDNCFRRSESPRYHMWYAGVIRHCANPVNKGISAYHPCGMEKSL